LSSFRPIDEDARQAARCDHDRSFVLEAGAGTGKTTLLIDRIEALIRTGRARLDEIAAVTFTENAATTMKLRLRERLEKARVDPAAGTDERGRAADALEVLERAQVSTIHALCAALLQERPLECGVAPGFRTGDEAETDLLFGEAWDEWLADRLVSADETLVLALENEIPLEGIFAYAERASLRGLARALLEQRDLEPLRSGLAVDAEAWRGELNAQASRATTLLAGARDGDTLVSQLSTLVAFAEGCRFLSGRALETRLAALPVAQSHVGQRRWWPSAEALEEGRRIAAWSRRAASEWAAARSAELHGRLVEAVLGVVARYERKKAERGVLDFLDLLLKARNALRDHESVRRYFRQRYRYVIIDEFQDTDPLQVEIAHLLAGGGPGALVVVGDAKQSIYRFRRADVTLFARAAREARERPGHAVLQLTQNFRSRPAILRFVNRVFAGLIEASEEAGQPGYQPIDPPPDLPEEPAVLALRFDAGPDDPYPEGDTLLRAEAEALAAYLAGVGEGALEVRDPANGGTRRSRAGDVMVLARRLTQVRHLEEALEAVGLRFTVEGGKSFFDRQEVHEILAVLRAVDDPSDAVSLVAALRSSFFGVSDRDVVAYSLSGGRLSLGAVDEGRPGAGALGPPLALLEELHRERLRLTVPALLDRLYDETRVLAALTGTRRGEGQVANLEKVATLARQASDLGVLTLRGFTRLLEERIENAREEPDLPSTRPGDPRTVRVLSVHKAKGLESPVVALFDTADDYRVFVDAVPLWDEGRIAVGFRQGCQPPSWSALVLKERARAEAERKRLLYVACTRARDFLLVPSPPPDARVGAFWRELVMHLPRADDGDVRVVTPSFRPDSPGLRVDFRALAAARGGDVLASRWDADRQDLLERAAERSFRPVSATRAAARTAPPPAFAPGSRGGRGFGALVHRVLEWMPLDDAGPERAASMAEALAPAYGLDADGARRAAEAALRALALPVMERARKAARVWRELALWFPEEDELVEGIVDLVFEEDGGLVVVDYKTDHIAAEHALVQAAHHAPQLQLYGRGLAQATGMRVKERLVLFTAIGQAVPV